MNQHTVLETGAGGCLGCMVTSRALMAPLALGLTLGFTSAGAQDEVEATLEPVVVTVIRGVEQRTFDTPTSVDVIDTATLQNAQLQVNLSETLARVPGLVAQNRQNYAQDIQISSRGFGARSTFGVRGLRLYADGIPASGPDGQGQVSHFDIASADWVEVLRGPFSALHGNSSGGVISIFTADGGPQTLASVSATLGSEGLHRSAVKLSGAEGAAQYNISAARFDTDGSRDHSTASRNSFNGKLKYSFSADTKVSLVLNSVRMPEVQDPLGLSRAEWEANPYQATPNAIAFNTRKSVDQTQAGLVLDHRLTAKQSLQLMAYTGSRATTQFQAIPVATQGPATQPGGVIDLDRGYRGLDARWIIRTRLAGQPLTLSAGLSTDRLSENRRGYQNFVGSTLGVLGALRRDEYNTVRNNDQYLQAEWQPAAHWRVSAGVRHSRVSFDSQDHYVVTGNPDDSGSVSYSATTPALGLLYHATDSINVYASAGRGFETPTMNELAYRAGGGTGLNFGLQAATSRQWELGVKAEFSDSWRGNVAYFKARTSNEIVVLTNSGGRSTFQNAGGTKRDGIEVSLSGRWGDGWSTQWALTTLNAVYTQDFMTCAAAPCTQPSTLIAAGNRLPGIPGTSLYGELAWQHRPWGLQTALEWRQVGHIYVNDRNTDAAPRYNVLNLRVSLTQKFGRWTVNEFLRIDNIANRKYAGSVIVNEANGRYFEPAPGRTWLLGVSTVYAF